MAGLTVDAGGSPAAVHSSRHRLPDLAAISLFAAVLLVPWIASSALFDRDETYYAEAAREMQEAGTWFFPRLNGREFDQKPFLPMAFIRVGYGVFGVNERGARMPSTLFGIGTALLTAAIARRLLGPAAGMRAGLILGSSLLFLLICRSSLVDSGFLLFFTGCLWAFLRTAPPETPSAGDLVLAYGCAGLAMLCKGPIGILLPLGIVTVIAWHDGGFGGLRRLRPLLGAGVLAAVALPWFVAASRATKGDFLRDFFLRENLGRFLSPMEGHRGPFWIYLPVLLVAFLPWSVFVPEGAAAIHREHRRVAWILGTWIVFPLAFFSAAATKLPHYILPTLPPLAILVSKGWEGRRNAARARRILPVVALLVLSAALPLALLAMRARWRDWVPVSLVVTASMIPAGAGAALLAGRRERLAFGSLLASMALFIWLLCGWALPGLEKVRVVRAVGLRLRDAGTLPTYSYGFLEPGLLFYGRRTIEPLDRLEEVSRAIAGQHRLLLVVREEEIPGLTRAGGATFEVLGIERGVCEDRGTVNLAVLRYGSR